MLRPYILIGASLMSAFLLARLVLGYAVDTHLVALALTWAVAGWLLLRDRQRERK